MLMTMMMIHNPHSPITVNDTKSSSQPHHPDDAKLARVTVFLFMLDECLYTLEYIKPYNIDKARFPSHRYPRNGEGELPSL